MAESYTLIAAGAQSAPPLIIVVRAEGADNARAEAVRIGKQLLPAGYSHFDLRDSGEGPGATLFATFEIEAAEPSVTFL